MSIYSYSWTTRQIQFSYLSRWRNKIFIWIFGIYPTLYSMIFYFHWIWINIQSFTSSKLNLFFYQIYTCYNLCNWMLHLYSCVHFHKIKVHMFIYKKLYSSNCYISYSFCYTLSSFPHFFSQTFWNKCWRTFFYQFLMSSLYWTISFWKIYYFTFAITHNLKLYVMWLFNIFFHINIWITKVCFCFRLCHNNRIFKSFLTNNDSHTFSATTSSSFYYYGISNFFCKIKYFWIISRYWTIRTRNYWNFRFFHKPSCSNFVPHFFNRTYSRTYKWYSTTFTNFRKVCVFW